MHQKTGITSTVGALQSSKEQVINSLECQLCPEIAPSHVTEFYLSFWRYCKSLQEPYILPVLQHAQTATLFTHQ